MQPGACDRRPEGASCALCGAGPADVRERWYCPSTFGGDPEATVGEEPTDGPTLVPGYAIRGALGSGGMGAVYLAEQVASGRYVALKVLTNANSPIHVQRFLRESHVLAGLAIDGTVRVLDHGEHQGRPWLAMEWIQGPSLAEVLERNPDLAATESVRIVREVAHTVHRLHQVGLVHRDIKPSNVVLTPDGQPVLVDFGLSRAVESGVHTALTQRPIGTPAYMAPELLKTEDVDWVRVDVYALGAMLARCVLGRTPRGDWDLDGVPRWLRPCIKRAISSRPEDRHSSAHAFAADLQRRPRTAWVIGGAGLLVGGLALGLGVGTCAPEPTLDVGPMLAPWAEVVRTRPDAAGTVFEALLDGATPAVQSRLWIGRAETLGTTEAWGEAWAAVEADDREAVVHGLASVLAEQEDFPALDALLTSHPAEMATFDPGGQLAARVDAFFLRVEDALPALSPEHARDLAAFREIRTLDGFTPTPTERGWACDPRGDCVAADGEVYRLENPTWPILYEGELYLWERGYLHVAGRPDAGCPIPERYNQFGGVGWNGRIHLSSKDPTPTLIRVDPTTCAVEEHPDAASWAGSYVNGALTWDADGDGVDELVVMLGPPYDYALRLYDVHDRLVDTLRIGSVREATVWHDALVVVTEQPHGNAVLFPEIREIGAHRVVFRDGRMVVDRTWPGSWRNAYSVDLDGDGRDSLMMPRADNRAYVYATPDSDPLVIDRVWLLHPTRLDDDSADELGVQTPEGHYLVGNGGHEERGVPRPEQRAPTGDAAVDRSLDLAALGLAGVAGRTLAIEALKRPRERAPWSTVAEFQSRAGRPTEAISAWLEAARSGTPDAWHTAVLASLREGDVDGARALVDEAGPALPADPRLLAALATHEETFEEPPRAWALREPLARWNPERGLLHVRSMGGAGVVARLPLRRTGDLAGFQLQLTLDQLEFAGDVWIRLADVDGGGPFVRVHAHGSKRAIHRSVTPQKWELHGPLDEDPYGPHTMTVRVALDGETMVFHHLAPDGTEERSELTVETAGGPLALEVSVLGPTGAMADLSIHDVTLWGLVPEGAPTLPAPAEGLQAALQATRLRTTPAPPRATADDPAGLAALETTYGLAWSMHRSASRLGERIAAHPGLDDPAVWAASPPLALIYADALLTRGDAVPAVEVLDAVPMDDATCVRRGLLVLAAQTALGGPPAQADLDACGEREDVVRSAAWSLGLR
ncbi:MAG: serine/threonine protein kinase [Alphaproteobacteria bacterium]|nr:serine/threonine protein kinase [Alphaproteobacteria bacterium]